MVVVTKTPQEPQQRIWKRIEGAPEEDEDETDSRKIPKELAELEHYLIQLSSYVEKYNRKREEENGVPETAPETEPETAPETQTCEMSFSVREDVAEAPTGLKVILMPPAEPISLISQAEKKDADVASNDSDIGIYFIQDVKLVSFIDVIHRELSTLALLFPSVATIVSEMRKEFDHLKTCCGCLAKASPLLPDILKELQELIKFVKKRRKESYAWPDDSDYLRKSSDIALKPFRKEDKHLEKKKIRQETVGFVTVHTKTPNVLREVETSALGKHASNCRSEHVRRYSVRLIDSPQLSVFRSETQSNLRFLEKAETVQNDRDNSFLTEYYTAQLLRILHPVPVLERALQLKITGSVTYSYSGTDGSAGGIRFVTLDHEESENPAAQAKGFLMTARSALGEACLALQQKGKLETRELKTGVRDLRELLHEAHKNQIELSKVLLEKGVLNAAVVQLTDPKMLREEKQGIEQARNSLIDGGRTLDDPTIQELQRSVEELRERCNAKNRMIIALLNGLRSNVPRQHWEELIVYVLREAGAEDFPRKGSPLPAEDHQSLRRCQEWKTCTRKEFEVEEITSEREVKRMRSTGKKPGKDKARISFSEVISKTSKCLHVVETELQSKTGLHSEAEKLLRDIESEISSMPKQQNRCERAKRERATMEQGTTMSEIVKPDVGSATINLTIKIGDEEAMSQYQSAVSVIPSGATLTEKKSEMSLPRVLERMPNVGRDSRTTTGRREASTSGSFTGVALKFKVPVVLREDAGNARIKVATPEEVISIAEATAELEKPLAAPDPSPVEKSSQQSLTGKAMTESQSDTSTLYPEISVYCEQNTTMEEQRSRLKFLEESLRGLTRTMDRMDVLTDKLSDDAYESSENFKDISNRYNFMSNCLRS